MPPRPTPQSSHPFSFLFSFSNFYTCPLKKLILYTLIVAHSHPIIMATMLTAMNMPDSYLAPSLIVTGTLAGPESRVG